MEDQQTQVIRERMEETREQLAEKLETLTDQVSEAVQTATEAVEGTVEAVKQTAEEVTETVQTTVQSVGESFDLALQFERRPWALLGGAVLVGFLAERLLTPSPRRLEVVPPTPPTPAFSTPPAAVAAPASKAQESKAPVDEEEPVDAEAKSEASQAADASPPAEPAEETWLGRAADRLKGIALGALTGALSEAATNSLPAEIGERVAEEIRTFAQGAGIEPIRPSDASGSKT